MVASHDRARHSPAARPPVIELLPRRRRSRTWPAQLLDGPIALGISTMALSLAVQFAVVALLAAALVP